MIHDRLGCALCPECSSTVRMQTLIIAWPPDGLGLWRIYCLSCGFEDKSPRWDEHVVQPEVLIVD